MNVACKQLLQGDRPVGEDDPGGHGVEQLTSAVLATKAVVKPAGQERQDVIPLAFEKLPRGQSEHGLAPLNEKVPGGQKSTLLEEVREIYQGNPKLQQTQR